MLLRGGGRFATPQPLPWIRIPLLQVLSEPSVLGRQGFAK